jgi:hypothetical protein
MCQASAGKRAFPFSVCCFLLLLAVAFFPGPAGAAPDSNIRFTLKGASTGDWNWGDETNPAKRYLMVDVMLANTYRGKDVQSMRDKSVRIVCEVVDTGSGKTVGQETFLERLYPGGRVAAGQTTDFTIGLPYPDALETRKNLELRVVSVAFEAEYDLEPVPGPPVSERIAPAYPVTLVPSGARWETRIADAAIRLTDTLTRQNLEGLAWRDGGTHPGPFGNVMRDEEWAAYVGRLPAHSWAENTALHLKTAFVLPDTGAVAALQLNATADNGFIAFLNGAEIARKYGEGFKSEDSGVVWEGDTTWEYSVAVDPALLAQGENVLEIYALDWGGKTYFAMELAAGEK